MPLHDLLASGNQSDIIAPTEHITNVDDYRAGLGWKRSEGIPDCEVIVALAARADLQAILSVSLEEQSQAPDVGVVSSPPCADRILRGHVVNHAHLCQVVRGMDIHGID